MSDFFSMLAENRLASAAISAVIAILSVFLLGYIVNLIEKIITKIISLFIGETGAFLLINRILFIGTIHHELSHALFAFLTGAKILKIVPIRFKGNELGRVEFKTRGIFIFRSLQQTMTSIAPVICGCITISILCFLSTNVFTQIWQQIIFIIMMISIFLHMDLSKQDLSVAMKGMPVCLILLIIIFLFLDINFLDPSRAYMHQIVKISLDIENNFAIIK